MSGFDPVLVSKSELDAALERVKELTEALVRVRNALDAEHEPNLEAGWVKANALIDAALNPDQGSGE